MHFPKTLSISGNMPFAQNELARCLAAMSGAEIRPNGYPFAILADQTEGEGYRVEVTEQRTVIQRSFWPRTVKFCLPSRSGCP